MPKRPVKRKQNPRTSRLLLGIGLLALVATLGLIVSNSNAGADQPPAGPVANLPAAGLDECGGATCGQADAPVTIEVYSDFQCPFCQRAEGVLQQLAGKYVETGKARLVYRNFVVIGPESESAAQAALCAGDQSRYWAFAHYLFSQQRAENSGVYTTAKLKRMATQFGLDGAAFNACLDSGKYRAQVAQEGTEGRQRGVRATPTFFINGQRHEGALPLNQMEALIEAALPE